MHVPRGSDHDVTTSTNAVFWTTAIVHGVLQGRPPVPNSTTTASDAEQCPLLSRRSRQARPCFRRRSLYLPAQPATFSTSGFEAIPHGRHHSRSWHAAHGSWGTNTIGTRRTPASLYATTDEPAHRDSTTGTSATDLTFGAHIVTLSSIDSAYRQATTSASHHIAHCGWFRRLFSTHNCTDPDTDAHADADTVTGTRWQLISGSDRHRTPGTLVPSSSCSSTSASAASTPTTAADDERPGSYGHHGDDAPVHHHGRRLRRR